MPRYVILEHDHPFPHWDLMLETSGVLRAWRLLALPAHGVDLAAEPLGDHRLAYLDYEGPVSGGRGRVARVDRGTLDWRRDEPRGIEVVLSGGRWPGRLVLLHEAGKAWTARFETQ